MLIINTRDFSGEGHEVSGATYATTIPITLVALPIPLWNDRFPASKHSEAATRNLNARLEPPATRNGGDVNFRGRA